MEWYILALASAFFSAMAAIVEKKILFKEKALHFSAVLALINLFFAIPFFFFADFSTLTSVSLAVLFLKSFLGALAFLCVMIALKNLELSHALPLLVLTPGLVALGGFIFLGEALNKFEMIGIGLLLIGTYLIQLRKNESILSPLKFYIKSRHHIYIAGALSLFTITSILEKSLLKTFSVSVNALMGLQHLFIAIIFICFVIFSKGKKEIKFPFKNSFKWMILLSVITIIYRYAEIAAMSNSPVALVLSLKRISVFFAVIAGGKLFKEHNLLQRTIATAIIVTGAILIIFG